MCGDRGNVKLGSFLVVLGSGILDQDGLDGCEADGAGFIHGAVDVADRKGVAKGAEG